MAKIVLKRKKSDKDTYLVRNVKSAYGELEYDDSLLEEDQVVEPIEKTNEEIQQQQLERAKEEEKRLAEEKARDFCDPARPPRPAESRWTPQTRGRCG